MSSDDSIHLPTHGEGLAEDLARLDALERRRGALRALAGLGALAALPLTVRGAGSCVVIEDETPGPFPADGTNGNGQGTINVLTQKGIVRSDIRPSFGSFDGVATGVPLTVTLQLIDVRGGCASLAGHAIYVWHCDQLGRYSLYNLTTENYLRGLQKTDKQGQVTFQTVFPGCYPGRWPHLHFETFLDRKLAKIGTNSQKTTQMALLAGPCKKVYDGDYGYTGSSEAFSHITLATDSVFGDDDALHEQPVMKGNPKDGYTATLSIGI
ncbi:MAG TPA: intradiol ring-cleavage dioxygenase [Burkholderiaceae bacterium]|jgi:protocatechuate 3,4-dioxygenase beta subunit|nr:intradiol ring-cleavage dioxygenase [Burkholderiaceae bacterium]